MDGKKIPICSGWSDDWSRDHNNNNLFNMENIIKSASKIVFILLAITVCVGFIFGKLESKDFMVIAGMAFTFYFSNKGDAKLPYAGK